MATTRFDKYAPFYDRFHGGDYQSDRIFLEAIIRRFLGRGPVTILDVACGTGSLAIAFGRRGHRLTGLDSSRGMLREARIKVSRAGIPLKLVRANMRNFDLNREFDVAYCVNAFGYLTSKKDVTSHLRSVRQHLKPQGIYIFDFPRRTGIPEEAQQWTYETGPRKIIDLSEYRQNRAGVVEWRSHWFVVRGNRIEQELHETFKSREYSLREIEKLVRQSRLKIAAVYGDREATIRPRRVQGGDVNPVVVAKRVD